MVKLGSDRQTSFSCCNSHLSMFHSEPSTHSLHILYNQVLAWFSPICPNNFYIRIKQIKLVTLVSTVDSHPKCTCILTSNDGIDKLLISLILNSHQICTMMSFITNLLCFFPSEQFQMYCVVFSTKIMLVFLMSLRFTDISNTIITSYIDPFTQIIWMCQDTHTIVFNWTIW